MADRWSFDDAQAELERLILLEEVAEERDERIRGFVRHLVEDLDIEPADLARRLGLSEKAVFGLLSEDTLPVEERLNLPPESLRGLRDEWPWGQGASWSPN